MEFHLCSNKIFKNFNNHCFDFITLISCGIIIVMIAFYIFPKFVLFVEFKNLNICLTNTIFLLNNNDILLILHGLCSVVGPFTSQQ